MSRLDRLKKFNRNMGCIEMVMPELNLYIDDRLIETWDVLKSQICEFFGRRMNV